MVDEAQQVRHVLEAGFSSDDHTLVFASTWEEGLRLYEEHRPDLVLVSVDAPGMPEWEACRSLLGETRVPIVFLAEAHREEDAVRALRSGAVDYVSKTVSPDILLARTRAALRRNDAVSLDETDTVYKDDYLTIDMAAHEVFVAGKPVQLTTTEYSLLVYLVQRKGRMCSKDQILKQIWGKGYEKSYHYVHLYIGRLRRKIERGSGGHEYFVSEYGRGYTFQAAADSEK